MGKGSNQLYNLGKQGVSAVKQGAQNMTGFVKRITGERRQLTPLNREEREMAQRMIDREHPLRNTLIWVTLPCLKPIRRWLPGFIPNQEEDSSDSEDADLVDMAGSLLSSANDALLPIQEMITSAQFGTTNQLEKYADIASNMLSQNKEDDSQLYQQLDLAFQDQAEEAQLESQLLIKEDDDAKEQLLISEEIPGNDRDARASIDARVSIAYRKSVKKMKKERKI